MRIQSINSNYNIKNYNRMSFKNGSKQALKATTDVIEHDKALKELKIGGVVHKGESTLEIVQKYLTYMLQFDMVRFVGVGDTTGSFGILKEGEDYYPFEPDDGLDGYMDIFDYMNLMSDLYNLTGVTIGENDKLETVQDVVDFIDKTTKVQPSVA